MEIAWEEAMRKFRETVTFGSYKINWSSIFHYLRSTKYRRSKQKLKVLPLISSENTSKIKVFAGAEKSLKELKNAGFKLSIATSKTIERTNQSPNFFQKLFLIVLPRQTT